MTALAPVEVSALAEYEQQVERGLSTFLDVGRALLSIRDQLLYRATHDTFDLYVEERWPSLGRAYAYRLLDAARVADAMSPMGDTPANERQARELAPLLDQPERLRETWQQVNEQTGGKPTAAAIRSVVRPEPTRITASTTEKTVEEFIADRETGEVLSVEDWQAAQAVQNVVDSDDGVRQARLRANYARLIEQAGAGLPLLDATATAAVLEPMHFDQAVRLRRRINDWFDALDAARPRGLRVVEGR